MRHFRWRIDVPGQRNGHWGVPHTILGQFKSEVFGCFLQRKSSFQFRLIDVVPVSVDLDRLLI
jgi:hypothetical protein